MFTVRTSLYCGTTYWFIFITGIQANPQNVMFSREICITCTKAWDRVYVMDEQLHIHHYKEVTPPIPTCTIELNQTIPEFCTLINCSNLNMNGEFVPISWIMLCHLVLWESPSAARPINCCMHHSIAHAAKQNPLAACREAPTWINTISLGATSATYRDN